MSASAVRMGGVFVEIGADPRKFFAALQRVQKGLAGMGSSLSSAGRQMTGVGVGALLPFGAAVRQGAAYESVLLNIKASTNASAAELGKLKAASMGVSQALGVGPTEAAQGFLELLKAGMSLESVLGGAGEAAIQFAKVGQMDVAAAAVVMSDAMNVFGVDSATAANTISAAADASSTSIELLSQSFSMVSAVAALANQSMGDTSAALAVLANAGVKGSDAGTALKTMLLRLMAPAEDAAKAMGDIGLSTDSFRNADGTMKPMVEIIRTLNGALGDMDQAAKDDVFRRIFGQDAIRAASILTSTGVDGFNDMRDAMGNALPVSEKYKTLMGGLAGAGQILLAAMQRLAISVSDAVGPALLSAAKFVAPLIDGLQKLVEKNKGLVSMVAMAAAGTLALGGVFLVLGGTLSGVAAIMGPILGSLAAIGTVAGAVLSPVGLLIAALVGVIAYNPQIVASISNAFARVGSIVGQAAEYIGGVFGPAVSDGMAVLGDLATTATTTFSGIYEALAEGDLAGAMDVLFAGLYAGWLRGTEAIMNAVDPWVSMFQNAFTILGAEVYKIWDGLWTSVGAAVNTAGAYLLGAFDNIINPILAAWDVLEAGIRKAWIRISGLFKDGEQKQKELDAVDAEMKDRAAQREKDRPGIEGRAAKAADENAQAEKERADRAQAIDASTQETIAGREAANAQRAGERRAAVQEAEKALGSKARGKRETRAQNEHFADLLKNIEKATSLDKLRELYDEFDTLSSSGRLTSGQIATLETALEDAQERVSKASSSMGGGESASSRAERGAQAAGLGGDTKAETVGTFSSVALGGMGFGSSLAQKQLDTLREIAHNTAENNMAEVAA